MSAKTEELARALARAYTNPAETLKATDFAVLTLDEAMEIQGAVLAALGEKPGVVKVAIMPDGTATVAPIMASLVVESGGRLDVPARGIVGVEVEIAARLKRDITPEVAARGAEGVLDAIETLICGIEVIGTRFDDRTKAGVFGPLADNSVTAGYVWAAEPWTGGTAIEGVSIEVAVDGRQIYAAPAKHPFGGVLSPIIAYGKTPRDNYGALRAGAIVTTGSLCGVVAVNGPSTVTARVGGTHEVKVQFV